MKEFLSHNNDSRTRRDRDVRDPRDTGHDVRALATIAAKALRRPRHGLDCTRHLCEIFIARKTILRTRLERVGHEELLVLGRDANIQ